MPAAERFYRALLLCYPAEFRREYGAEMAQTFRDRWREEHNPFLWFEILADVAVTAAREHCHMLWNDLRYTARTLRKAPRVHGRRRPRPRPRCQTPPFSVPLPIKCHLSK
jgi:hypothetical protein